MTLKKNKKRGKKSNFGDSPNRMLLYNASHGNIEGIKEALERGANAFNHAMEEAVYGGHMNVVKLIVELGADEFGRDDFNAVMLLAAQNGHIDIVKLMVESGANDFNKAMATAAMGGHMDIVKLMVELGVLN